MESQQELNFNRIAQAITFLTANFKAQPSLEEAAAQVSLSPYHFQRMFLRWAGVTPKQFLQYLTIEHAKLLLRTSESLFYTAVDSGLSGTGRLHDLFVKIEGMTPGEYKHGGAALSINYSFSNSPFGQMLVAATGKGLCHMAFTGGDEPGAFALLQAQYPRADFRHLSDPIQKNALLIFTQDWSKIEKIRLHLKGTDFQIKVWQTLLTVPSGALTTYATLAAAAGFGSACRAVGTAVGSNPIGLLIPCHRVIRGTGETGQYHWGVSRKKAMIGWEAAKKANKQ